MDLKKKARYDASKTELPITNRKLRPFIPQAPD